MDVILIGAGTVLALTVLRLEDILLLALLVMAVRLVIA
jgi:hypothetical protein